MSRTCLETIIIFCSSVAVPLVALKNVTHCNIQLDHKHTYYVTFTKTCLSQTNREQVRSSRKSNSSALASQSTWQECYQDITLKSSTVSKWQLLSLQPSQCQTSAIRHGHTAGRCQPTYNTSIMNRSPSHTHVPQVTFKPWATPKYITWTVGEHNIKMKLQI